MSKIYLKKEIHNDLISLMYKQGYLYSSIQTDVFKTIYLKKNNFIKIILNNFNFNFISKIEISFINDFDTKFFFNNLPYELNDIIHSYLILEDSIKIELYNENKFYHDNIILNYEIFKTKKRIKYIFNIHLKDNILKNIINNNNNINNTEFNELLNQLPNYIFNDDYGFLIKSKINRLINIYTLYINYNNENFYNYNDVLLKEL